MRANLRLRLWLWWQQIRKYLAIIIITIAVILIALIVEGYNFNWPLWLLPLLIVIGILFLFLLTLAGYTTKWTGLKGKTLWDWLNLLAILLIPLVVVGATIAFGSWQTQLADLQHHNDMLLSNDQQQETTLKTYLDDMTTLLLDKKLGSQDKADKVASAEAAIVARERTLTTLRRLGADRNKIVFQFLQDAHLIGKETVIDLSNADLSGDDLSGANLLYAHLDGANMSGALQLHL
jgi:uncharacterized membrane protein YccC